MPDTQVNRLFEFLSPVATIRLITTSVWCPIDYVLGIPRRICSLCFGCVCFALQPITYVLETVKVSRQSSQQESPQVQNLPHLLTGVPDPTSEQVSNAVRGMHNCAINAMINQISRRNRIREYRSELIKWKEEKEREMVDLFDLEEKDRTTMKTLVRSVKKLRVLKAKKSKFAKLNDDKVQKVANKINITSEDLKLIQESKKNLIDIESEMSKNKKDFLDIVKKSGRLSHLFTKVLLHSDPFLDYTPDAEIPLNVIVNRLRAITYKSQMDNDSFKSTLVVTNEKLDKLLSITERISSGLTGFAFKEQPDFPSMKNELAALRSQLEQEQLVLRNVTGERDVMKGKLDVLEDLIEDQEDFLNSRENNTEMKELAEQ